MGADLFDSNVASMAAALVMATALGGPDSKNVAMVFAYAAIGLLSSLLEWLRHASAKTVTREKLSTVPLM